MNLSTYGLLRYFLRRSPSVEEQRYLAARAALCGVTLASALIGVAEDREGVAGFGCNRDPLVPLLFQGSPSPPVFTFRGVRG